MLATNHALAGALVASVLPLPLAVPVALASHFALDALPHYGIAGKLRNRSKTYRIIVFSDITVALTGALGLALLHKWSMELGAWVAWSPDLLWVIYYFTHRKNSLMRPENWFMRFHLSIQRWERPWGIYVELLLFFALLPIYLLKVLE